MSQIHTAILSVFILTLILTGCGTSEHFEGTATNFSRNGSNSPPTTIPGGNTTPASTLEAFEKTLFPVMRANCAACHGALQMPLHSVADAQTAMNTIINSALVDFSNAPNSRLVVKIRGGHNGFPAALADQLQTAIVAWIDQARGNDPSQNLPVVEPLTPTFTSIYNRILVPKCVGCHGAVEAREGVRFDTYARAMREVSPGSPNNSKLFEVLDDGEMPPRSANNPVSSEERGVIRTWIQNGALNN